jgi:hypothetical protein
MQMVDPELRRNGIPVMTTSEENNWPVTRPNRGERFKPGFYFASIGDRIQQFLAR